MPITNHGSYLAHTSPWILVTLWYDILQQYTRGQQHIQEHPTHSHVLWLMPLCVHACHITSLLEVCCACKHCRCTAHHLLGCGSKGPAQSCTPWLLQPVCGLPFQACSWTALFILRTVHSWCCCVQRVGMVGDPNLKPKPDGQDKGLDSLQCMVKQEQVLNCGNSSVAALLRASRAVWAC